MSTEVFPRLSPAELTKCPPIPHRFERTVEEETFVVCEGAATLFLNEPAGCISCTDPRRPFCTSKSDIIWHLRNTWTALKSLFGAKPKWDWDPWPAVIDPHTLRWTVIQWDKMTTLRCLVDRNYQKKGGRTDPVIMYKLTDFFDALNLRGPALGGAEALMRVGGRGSCGLRRSGWAS